MTRLKLSTVTYVWQQITAPHWSITDLEMQRQSRLFARFTIGLSAVMILAMYQVTLNPVRLVELYPRLIIALAILTAITIGSYILNHGGKYRLSANLFTGSLFLFAHLPLFDAFPFPAILPFVIITLLISAILLPLRSTVALSAASLVIQLFSQLIDPKIIPMKSMDFLLVTLCAVPVIITYVQYRVDLENERRADLEVSNAQLRLSQVELYKINQQLRVNEESLERRVAERTRDLQVAMDVSRQITTVFDLNELLQAVIESTRAGFGLTYVSVFLYNADTQIFDLAAGTGTAGEVLKAAGWQFITTATGLVPEAVRQQTVVLSNDVLKDSRYQPVPQLPDTRAELVVPMLIANKMIGVLDFQSDKVDQFSTDDVRVMTALAEQTAIAVNNAYLYAEQIKTAEQLRSVDQLKSHFLANMSHELRTPLNAILNFTEFVSSGMLGPVNEKQVDALKKSLDSSKHLLSLISDILDMSKIESGKLELFVEDNIDLQSELRPVIAVAQALLQNKAVCFIQDIDNDLPRLSGDRRRIRQILLNLIANAAKFTETGSITLSVKNRGDEVLFAVIDTGPGIAPADQQFIFEPFIQTALGMRHTGGTGLGLPISKRLAEAHGGRLWVESKPEAGSEFYVLLPLTVRAEPEL